MPTSEIAPVVPEPSIPERGEANLTSNGSTENGQALPAIEVSQEEASAPGPVEKSQHLGSSLNVQSSSASAAVAQTSIVFDTTRVHNDKDDDPDFMENVEQIRLRLRQMSATHNGTDPTSIFQKMQREEGMTLDERKEKKTISKDSLRNALKRIFPSHLQEEGAFEVLWDALRTYDDDTLEFDEFDFFVKYKPKIKVVRRRSMMAPSIASMSRDFLKGFRPANNDASTPGFGKPSTIMEEEENDKVLEGLAPESALPPKNPEGPRDVTRDDIDQVRLRLRQMCAGYRGLDTKRLWNKWDRDRTGWLSYAELRIALKNILPFWLQSDREFVGFWEHFGTEKSGYLSYEKFDIFINVKPKYKVRRRRTQNFTTAEVNEGFADGFRPDNNEAGVKAFGATGEKRKGPSKEDSSEATSITNDRANETSRGKRIAKRDGSSTVAGRKSSKSIQQKTPKEVGAARAPKERRDALAERSVARASLQKEEKEQSDLPESNIGAVELPKPGQTSESMLREQALTTWTRGVASLQHVAVMDKGNVQISGASMDKSFQAMAMSKRLLAQTVGVASQDDFLDEEEVRMVKSKIRAASYKTGGANLEKLFQEWDKDHNNFLDYKEVKTAIAKILPSKASLSKEELKQLCLLLDRNGDGKIDMEEFKSFLRPNKKKGRYRSDKSELQRKKSEEEEKELSVLQNFQWRARMARSGAKSASLVAAALAKRRQEMSGKNIVDFQGKQWTAVHQSPKVHPKGTIQSDFDNPLLEMESKMAANAVDIVAAIRRGDLDAKDLHAQLALLNGARTAAPQPSKNIEEIHWFIDSDDDEDTLEVSLTTPSVGGGTSVEHWKGEDVTMGPGYETSWDDLTNGSMKSAEDAREYSNAQIESKRKAGATRAARATEKPLPLLARPRDGANATTSTLEHYLRKPVRNDAGEVLFMDPNVVGIQNKAQAVVADGTSARPWRLSVQTPWMGDIMTPTWPTNGGTWVYVPHPPRTALQKFEGDSSTENAHANEPIFEKPNFPELEPSSRKGDPGSERTGKEGSNGKSVRGGEKLGPAKVRYSAHLAANVARNGQELEALMQKLSPSEKQQLLLQINMHRGTRPRPQVGYPARQKGVYESGSKRTTARRPNARQQRGHDEQLMRGITRKKNGNTIPPDAQVGRPGSSLIGSSARSSPRSSPRWSPRDDRFSPRTRRFRQAPNVKMGHAR